MKRLIITLTACLFCITACSPVLPASPTATAPAALSSASDQLNLFATQTQSAALASTAAAQQEPNVTHMPVHSPSPLPDLTQVHEVAGPFHQVSRQEALILGKVLDLQPVDDGFLLFSEGGISYFKDEEWTGYFTQEMGYPVGVDAGGHSWVVDADGSHIYRDERSIRNIDPSIQIDDTNISWIGYSAEEGWIPVTDFSGSPVKFGLAGGMRGDLWFSTKQDVRMFDNTWQVYDSISMDMPDPTGDTVSEFTIIPIEHNGEIYVGRCDWGSSGPVGGGGWRSFDGSSWSEPDPLLNAGCVTAFAPDDADSIWIAQDANLWRFNPVTTALEDVSLPEPPAPYRFGYINNLTTAPDESLWAQLALCTEEACFGGEAVYRLKDGIWQQIGEPSPAGGQRLIFDGSGTAWLVSAGSIYQVVDEQFQPVPGLVVQAAAVDDGGTLWLVAQSSGSPTLWVQR